MAWSFSGKNPLVFTPTLLRQLDEYKSLLATPNPSQEAINAKVYEIQRSLGMVPPGEQSIYAKSGSEKEDYLFNYLHPDANDLTFSSYRAIPPVRVAPGVYVGGTADVIALDERGRPRYVEDIKTIHNTKGLSPDAFKPEFVQRLKKYPTEGFQNIYATSLGLPNILYRGFAYNSPRDPASKFLFKTEHPGTAPSLKQVKQWTEGAIQTLSSLGPEYVEAAVKRSQENFVKRVVEPHSYWSKRQVTGPGMEQITSEEALMFKDLEIQTLVKQSDQERRAEEKVRLSYQGKSAGQIYLDNDETSATESGPGAGELLGTNKLSRYARSIALARGIRAFERGDDEFAQIYLNAWKDSKLSLADVMPIMRGQHERTQKQREREKEENREQRAWEREQNRFLSAQDRAVFGALKKGDYQAASIYNSAKDLGELQEAIIKVAEASRKAKEAETERADRMNRAFHQLQSIEPYDWTRWYKARAAAWGEIQQAGSWLPGFIREPASRLGTAAMQMYEADVARKKGWYDAAAKGAVPLGGAIGSAFGVPGLFVGTAIGGVVSAGSQIIGNIGEGQIKAAGAEISSRLNMWGGVISMASTAVGMSLKALLLPLNLFASALKIVVPSVVGLGAALASIMISGLRSMGQLGNPLTSLTQSTYTDYQRSTLMDVMSGMGTGSTASSVQSLAARRQGFFLGRASTSDMINAALLGNFSELYKRSTGNEYEDYNNLVTSYARRFYSMNPQDRANKMYLLNEWDSTMASHVQTLLQKYDQTKSTDMTWGQYTNPKTYGIPFRAISDKERVGFREMEFSYKALTESINVDKIRVAGIMWKAFGEGILTWVEKLYNLVASGGSLKDVLSYVGNTLKSLWDSISKPVFSDAVNKIVGFGEKLLDVLGGVLGSLAEALKPAIIKVSEMMFDVFWSLGESLYKAFRSLILNLSSVKFDLGGLKKFLSGAEGSSLADVFKFTAPLNRAPIDEAPKTTRLKSGEIAIDLPWGETLFQSSTEPWKYTKNTGVVSSGKHESPAAKAVYDLINATPFFSTGQYAARNRGSINDILTRTYIWAIANNVEPWQAVQSIRGQLVDRGLDAEVISQIDQLIQSRPEWQASIDKAFSPLSKEKAKAALVSGVTSFVNGIDTQAAIQGLVGAGKGLLDIHVTIATEDGQKVLEKTISGVSELTQEAVQAAVDIFGDMTSRLDNLALDRAKQRVLAKGAAGGIK